MSKPKQKIKIEWSPEFAYGIGLIATDGNLSPDGRHLNFTTKDKELAVLFKKIFNLDNKIGRKTREKEQEKKYFVVQFGDINFYKFLLKIGLMPKKSKILGCLKIPDKYFHDFLRGAFDGDGSFYSYWDPRWKSSFMFYTYLYSASRNHISWLKATIKKLIGINGAFVDKEYSRVYKLVFAKKESLKLLKFMYYNEKVVCLYRKKRKIEKALRMLK